MKVIWTQPARNDFIQTLDFIRSKNPVAARQVAEVIENACRRIGDFPGIGKPGKLEETREFSIFSIPYNIIYRVHRNTVEILGLLHHKQQWP